jgi:aryl-alcohol dehydrogenase-like predicted oxidoreductase
MTRTPDARTYAGLDRLAVEAQIRGVSIAGLALAWVLSAPGVTAPIVAPRGPEQWIAVSEALGLRLEPAEREYLAGFFT